MTQVPGDSTAQTLAAIEAMDATEAAALIETLSIRNETLLDKLQEAGEFGTAQLAFEDLGWQPLIGISDGANCFNLRNLHHISEMCRAVATINPLVGRGLEVRAGYIWGPSVKIVAEEFLPKPGRPRTVNTTPTLPPGLDDVLTGAQAQWEIDQSAACDGNLFFLIDRKNQTVQRIPLENITDGVSQRGNRERLMYIRRTWDDWDLEQVPARLDRRPITQPMPDRSGAGRTWDSVGTGPNFTEGVYRTTWYPTQYVMGPVRDNINGEEVDRSKVMVHAAFNRKIGWRWGVPDVLPAVWWTKAYKEFLENSAILTKAYARFAWKITNDKSRNVKRTAASLAATPQRDPATGTPMQVGASAVLGAGQDLSAIQRNTSVDFDAGRPLAAMIAASLGVPLPALTCDPTTGTRSATQTLDTSTVLVMKARQKTMDEILKTVFRVLGLRVKLRWPEINDEPVHRRVQAIDMSARLGVLRDSETRAMVVDAWGDKWDDFTAEPPKTINDLPWALRPKPVLPGAPAARGSKTAPATAGPKENPGIDGGTPRLPDPMSRGDHELRDEGTQDHVRNG